MAVFAYSGTDESRTAIKGTVAADTPRQARDVLRSKGVQVNKLSEFVPRANASPLSMLTLGRARNQWNTAIHELSMLLHAGIPLLEALDTIAEGRGLSGVFRTAMLEARDRVAAGASFAEALAQRPDLFDATSVHLVEVGENAGTLEHVLSQLAEFKLRSMQFKDQVFTAMMYPVFLMCFGTAAAIFLMTAVMPPLLENLQETLDTLPWPTQVAQALSNLLVNYGFLIAVASAAGLFALVVYVRTPGGQQQWHRTLLRIPVLGPMAVKQSVSRIAMVIATLSRSGVVLTKAVDLAARSTDNVIIRQALEDCGKAMGAGEDISAALNRSGILPPLAVRVFSVGQESGQLDEMLERLATDYERQLASTSARITALLEPMLILVLAAFVGFLLLATILPILEAGSVMN